MADEAPSPRLGSSADLARRLDRLEINHEQLAKDVSTLSGTIQRVEQNQTHLEELNRLRFNALDTSVGTLTSKLDNFIARVEGLITGEVQTPQMRSGEELVADYRRWRESVDKSINELVDHQGQQELLAKERERASQEAASVRTSAELALHWRVTIVISAISAAFGAVYQLAYLLHNVFTTK